MRVPRVLPLRGFVWSLWVGCVAMLVPLCTHTTQAQEQPKLRIIAIGAHPDDCDIKAGGLAIKLAKLGHRVRFVSLTNGDAGHFEMDSSALAKRRFAEAKEAGTRANIDYVILDNKDGRLEPTLKVREQIIRQIRQWRADIVLTHRPNDYHPDHRYTGIAVQDAAYMVTVPHVVVDTPALRANPVFLYFQDQFEKPAPFRPDVVVAIDDVIDAKYHMLDAHVSQFYEWLPWLEGKLKDVPQDVVARRQWLKSQRPFHLTPAMKKALVSQYGPKTAASVHTAEAFEMCEYGKASTAEELRRLFAFSYTRPSPRK